MQQVQRTLASKQFSLVLTVLLVAAVAGIWAISTVSASKPATIGAAVPAEAAAAILPMELMIIRGGQLPVADYTEPF